jgi:hypothetical protein
MSGDRVTLVGNTETNSKSTESGFAKELVETRPEDVMRCVKLAHAAYKPDEPRDYAGEKIEFEKLPIYFAWYRESHTKTRDEPYQIVYSTQKYDSENKSGVIEVAFRGTANRCVETHRCRCRLCIPLPPSLPPLSLTRLSLARVCAFIHPLFSRVCRDNMALDVYNCKTNLGGRPCTAPGGCWRICRNGPLLCPFMGYFDVYCPLHADDMCGFEGWTAAYFLKHGGATGTMAALHDGFYTAAQSTVPSVEQQLQQILGIESKPRHMIETLCIAGCYEGTRDTHEYILLSPAYLLPISCLSPATLSRDHSRNI